MKRGKQKRIRETNKNYKLYIGDEEENRREMLKKNRSTSSLSSPVLVRKERAFTLMNANKVWKLTSSLEGNLMNSGRGSPSVRRQDRST